MLDYVLELCLFFQGKQYQMMNILVVKTTIYDIYTYVVLFYFCLRRFMSIVGKKDGNMILLSNLYDLMIQIESMIDKNMHLSTDNINEISW